MWSHCISSAVHKEDFKDFQRDWKTVAYFRSIFAEYPCKAQISGERSASQQMDELDSQLRFSKAEEKLRLRESAPELTAAELLATEAERLEEERFPLRFPWRNLGSSSKDVGWVTVAEFKKREDLLRGIPLVFADFLNQINSPDPVPWQILAPCRGESCLEITAAPGALQQPPATRRCAALRHRSLATAAGLVGLELGFTASLGAGSEDMRRKLQSLGYGGVLCLAAVALRASFSGEDGGHVPLLCALGCPTPCQGMCQASHFREQIALINFGEDCGALEAVPWGAHGAIWDPWECPAEVKKSFMASDALRTCGVA
eukprot:Skav235216  [mRNA]  locus=scaffold3995:48998:64848:+ [translate_table: standard]